MCLQVTKNYTLKFHQSRLVVYKSRFSTQTEYFKHAEMEYNRYARKLEVKCHWIGKNIRNPEPHDL